MTDEKCLRAIAAGGSGAQAGVTILFRRYHRHFIAFLLRRRVRREDAEDIVQDVFVNLMTALKGADVAVADGRAYLYTALRNRFLDYLRSGKRLVMETDLGVEWKVDDVPVLEWLMREYSVEPEESGFLECFYKAWKSFHGRNQEGATVVDLKVQGFSGEEIAEIIGRTHGATREFLSQTIRRFQQVLTSLCGDFLPDHLRSA